MNFHSANVVTSDSKSVAQLHKRVTSFTHLPKNPKYSLWVIRSFIKWDMSIFNTTADSE